MLSRQSVLVAILQAIQSGLAAINVIMTASVLQPHLYGEYVYLVTMASIPPLLAGLGVEHLFLMEASRAHHLTRTYFSNALLIRGTVSALLLAVIAIYCWHCTPDRSAAIILINAGLFLAAFPSGLFLALYRVEGRHLRPWLMALPGPMFFFVFIMHSRENTVSLEKVARAFFLSHLFVTVIFVADMIRFVRLECNLRRLFQDIRTGLVFSVSQAFDFVFARIDIVVIKHFAGSGAVGIYAAGQRIVALSQMVPSSFNLVELPEFHRVAGDAPALTQRFLALRRLLFEIGLLLLGVTAINAQLIVRLFFGPEYAAAGGIVALLSLASLVLFVNYPYYMLAEAMRYLKGRLGARILTFFVTVPLVIGGTLLAGVVGAAIGMLIGQVFFLLRLHRLTMPINGGWSAFWEDRDLLAMMIVSPLVALAVSSLAPKAWQVAVIATVLYLAMLGFVTWSTKRSPAWHLARGMMGSIWSSMANLGR